MYTVTCKYSVLLQYTYPLAALAALAARSARWRAPRALARAASARLPARAVSRVKGGGGGGQSGCRPTHEASRPVQRPKRCMGMASVL